MRISEIQNTPQTPEQQKIAALKHTKDLAAKALDAERKRQQMTKAQATLNALKLPSPEI